MSRYTIIFIIKIALFFLMASTLISCQKKDSVYKKTMPVMDTIVAISVVSDSREKAEAAIDRAFAEISRFGEMISFYSDSSELADINNNAGIRAVRVSPETLEAVEKAVFVAEKSGGAFDPSIGPVVRLWDFSNKKRPAPEDVKKALKCVGYHDIDIDRLQRTVFLKRKGMMLDLGAIAKGYAADIGAEALKRYGISAGLVAIAGDIKAFGKKPDNGVWKIGLKNPRQTNDKDELIGSVRLIDMAISTAGDYERFFIENGVRYHHILDPSTGHPAGRCRSVSVMASTGIYADGFDTAIFILGPDKGIALAEAMGLDAIITDNEGKVTMTKGFKERTAFEKGN